MKHLFCLLLTLALLCTTALAEVDTAPLTDLPNLMTYSENGVDMVFRSTNQPFFGVADDETVDVCAYIDYVDMPNEHVVALRLTVSIATFDAFDAATLEITEGGKTYVFPVSRVVSEYDMTYYEDYQLYMTDESLPLIKAMARSKSDEHVFTLRGLQSMACTITIPGDEIAALYDRYVDIGGTHQDFTALHGVWPVKVK